MDIQAINPSDVLKAYSGRPGCMCGCNGKYYVTRESKEEAGKWRGYPYDERNVKPGQVTRILHLCQAAVAEGKKHDVAGDGLYVYVEVSDRRCYCIYLNQAARERLFKNAG